jgi:hypothetical protein
MHFPPPFGWSKILIFYDFSLSGLQTIRPLLRPGFIKVIFYFTKGVQSIDSFVRCILKIVV